MASPLAPLAMMPFSFAPSRETQMPGYASLSQPVAR